MDIARYAIDKPVNTWLIMLACLLGGIWGVISVGKLEDPSFTLKTALVVTGYSGATAKEVETEVTEVLETAIQEMGQLDYIESTSTPGLSTIEVEIKPTYASATLPQIWDELRRKVNDAQGSLPNGAGPSLVVDDFGDVYGIFYAVTARGFSDKQKRDVADFLRRELLTVPNVAKVSIAGEPTETIYVEISDRRLKNLGISVDQIVNAITNENAVADAGSVRLSDGRLRLSVVSPVDAATDLSTIKIGRAGTAEQINLSDIATIKRLPTELQDHPIRFNGEEAFTVAIAGTSDANIVRVGEGIDEKLAELAPQIPLGVEINPIYEQHKIVSASVWNFVNNLAMSVTIVIGVLWLFMGWRMSLVVGATLLLTVLGTVFFMSIFSIEMERISLGALIIAMGMLVDNSLVIAEGMLIGIQQGKNARDAASDTAGKTQIPLLGATVIGIMAFAGIGLSSDDTGEFLFSLFAVIAISLLLSWFLAVTATPLLGNYVLKSSGRSENSDPYAGRVYQLYRSVLMKTFGVRRAVVLALVGLTGAAMFGFGFIKQSFFPDNSNPLFYVEYYLPQGADIRATTDDAEKIEEIILAEPDVVSVAGFVGQGASRFTLTYNPEQPNTAYAFFLIRTTSIDVIDPIAARLVGRIRQEFLDAEVWSKRLVFGPPYGAKLQPRFSGPGTKELRRLAEEAQRIMAESGLVTDIRQNWRQKQVTIVPQIQPDRADSSGVDRTDIAAALEFATTGTQAGTYREGDDLIPIVVRPPDAERLDIDQLQDRLIWSSAERVFVPITQVVSRFDTVSQEVVIRRRDRVRTLTVEGEPLPGLTGSQALAAVKGPIEAIPLKTGYGLEWGGELESSADAQSALAAQLPAAFLIMLVITILLFAKLRQPFMIWCVVPMSICGVTAGLLFTGMPFSFTALLGLLSLSGMLIKNAIVLVDEIDDQVSQKGATIDALAAASVSRLRPVFLAAVTTILGMIPLLPDAFFASMSVTIMGGLAFATILTLIAIPTLYSLMYGITLEKGRAATA